MATKLTASVGKGGINREADVFAVQTYLMNWIRLGPLMGKVAAPPLSGKCDPTTMDAIRVFQKVIVGMSYPDCRIDPGGATFKKLSGPLTLALPASTGKTQPVRPHAASDLKRTRFLWVYFPTGTETVKQIGQKHGYSLDYGPIANFPLNRPFDDPATRPARGEIVFIPWPEGLLRKMRRGLATGLAVSRAHTEKLMAEIDAEEARINDLLLKIDMVSIGANIVAGFGLMVHQGIQRLAPHAAEKTAAELTKLSLIQFSKGLMTKDAHIVEMVLFLLDHAGSTASLLSTLALPAPKAPERRGLYYLRHAFGFWNPSYMAQLAVAVYESDAEIWMYGSSVIAYREKARLQRSYARQAAKVSDALRGIDEQLACKYYSAGSLISYDW